MRVLLMGKSNQELRDRPRQDDHRGGDCRHDTETKGEETEMSNILGINKRYYPNPVQNNICEMAMANGIEVPDDLINKTTIVTAAVLVAGEIGDYACYIGHSEDPEWIADFGNKISFEEARCHFPGIEKEKYRE